MPRHHPARDPLSERIRQERLEWAKSLRPGRFVGGWTGKWVGPEKWLYLPDLGDPFGFIRSNGQLIEPQTMFTDGGSINAWLEVLSGGVTRWSYGNAFIPHDWAFEAHHRGLEGLGFYDANLMLAEAMRTLQLMGICPDRPQDIVNVYWAVQSSAGRQVWDKDPYGS